MDKFDQVYQSIILEAKFGNKKWVEKEGETNLFFNVFT